MQPQRLRRSLPECVIDESMQAFSLRSYLLFFSMAVGLIFQGGNNYSFLIKYLVMTMLFLSLIDCRVPFKTLFHPRLWQLLGFMGGIAIATFALFRLVNADLAIIAVLLAVTPTATAAPVVTRFLKGRVEYVMASVILTNGLMALVIPLLLPLLGNDAHSVTLGQVLNGTLVVVGVPLVLSQLLVNWAPPALLRPLQSVKNLSFYLWIAGLYLACSKAGYFITRETGGAQALLGMATVALVLCAVNFGLGRWLGGSSLAQETSQSLGQKNTMFAVWLCLTFLSPHMALGPMFYIIFQNLYNSYLMAKA